MDKVYKKIIQNSSVGYRCHKLLYDINGLAYDYKCIKVNKAFERYTGLKAEDLLGEKINSLLPDIVGKELNLIEYCEKIAINDEREQYEKHFESTDRWCRIEIFSPGKTYFIISCIDITEEKKIEENLKNHQLRIEHLIKISRSVLWELDSYGTCTYLSPVAEEILGYSPDEAIGKMHVDQAFDQEAEESYRRSILPMISKKEILCDYESKIKTKDNEDVWVSTNGYPVLDQEGNLLYYRGISVDVSHLKKIEEDIRFLSFRDQLTGLYNRRFFEEELERLDTERNLPLSLIMIDVDGLKLVNDAFGHRAGDVLIKKVANIIAKESRVDDIISRIGGDEFLILLPKTSLEKAKILVDRINEEIKKEKVEAINLSISYGSETKINVHENIEDVFKKADIKMYNYKNSKSRELRKENIETILERLFEKSFEEKSHSNSVSKLSMEIGKALKLADEEVEKLRMIGKFHDIGKIVISDHILTKKDKLIHEEWEEVKRHSELGYIILSSSDEYISFAKDVLYHHERYDGTGYPKGLREEEIPLNSRIVALADAYDIITSDRPYKKAMSRDQARNILLKESGKQFDPKIVEAFLQFNIAEKY